MRNARLRTPRRSTLQQWKERRMSVDAIYMCALDASRPEAVDVDNPVRPLHAAERSVAPELSLGTGPAVDRQVADVRKPKVPKLVLLPGTTTLDTTHNGQVFGFGAR